MGRRHLVGPRVDRIPRVPEGWRVLETWGSLSFVTHALLERPDGSRVEWDTRRHRKHLGLRAARGTHLADLDLRKGGHGSTSSWRMGALFTIGAFCFALGSFPPYFNNVDAEVAAVTFFVGSIFFTSAASLQFHEAVGAPTGVEPGAPPPPGYRSFLGLEPHRIDWWASAVQLVGTVFFNISTFAATRSDLSLQQERHLVWAPDVWGSICFLVASWLAYSEVSPRLFSRPERTLGWWTSSLNLLGSVAFGVAAVAARYVGNSGEVANLSLVNLGTFLGGVCFFIGAALLPVESARETSTPAPS